MGLGIEDRLREIQADPATTIEDYTLLRAALLRLLDPAAMGRFRVMVFGRDWPAGASRSACSATGCPRDGPAERVRLGRMPYCPAGAPQRHARRWSSHDRTVTGSAT